MFWLLINYTLKKEDQFTNEQLFQKYWIKYQLYIEWQKFLMDRIEKVRSETAKMANSEDTMIILLKEFWELTMAKFFYMVDRDDRIIKDYAPLFFKEMMEQIE